MTCGVFTRVLDRANLSYVVIPVLRTYIHFNKKILESHSSKRNISNIVVVTKFLCYIVEF